MRVEKRHRGSSGLPYRHRSKRIVERRGGGRNWDAVAKVERCRDPLVGCVEARSHTEAERVRVRHARIERMREEAAVAATHHRPGGTDRLPGKSESGSEILPMGGIWRCRIPVYSQKFHHPRRARDRIDLALVET